MLQIDGGGAGLTSGAGARTGHEFMKHWIGNSQTRVTNNPKCHHNSESQTFRTGLFYITG